MKFINKDNNAECECGEVVLLDDKPLNVIDDIIIENGVMTIPTKDGSLVFDYWYPVKLSFSNALEANENVTLVGNNKLWA